MTQNHAGIPNKNRSKQPNHEMIQINIEILCISHFRKLQQLSPYHLGLILSIMDSERTQPLVNNYPGLDNPGWTPTPPPINNRWPNNPNQPYNSNPIETNSYQLNHNPNLVTNQSYNPYQAQIPNPNQPIYINPNQGFNPNPNPQNNPNFNPTNPYAPFNQMNHIANQINQGIKNIPPANYSGQQPLMPGQQPMPNVSPNRIVIIRESSSTRCQRCGFDGMGTWRQIAGNATYLWCICLFCFIWPLFWVPFCIDSCYDTEILCSRCGQTKARVQADCC